MEMVKKYYKVNTDNPFYIELQDNNKNADYDLIGENIEYYKTVNLLEECTKGDAIFEIINSIKENKVPKSYFTIECEMGIINIIEQKAFILLGLLLLDKFLETNKEISLNKAYDNIENFIDGIADTIIKRSEEKVRNGNF